jgi:hypothetical protein
MFTDFFFSSLIQQDIYKEGNDKEKQVLPPLSTNGVKHQYEMEDKQQQVIMDTKPSKNGHAETST